MRRLFPILLAVIFLMSPLIVLADPWYSDPSFTSTGLVPCNGPECQACHVVQLGQNIINFFVMIAAFIAVIIFTYAGFLMLTAAGNTGQVSKATGMFTNVVVGLVIVLAGWLIIDTVMKYAFVGSALDSAMNSKFGPWNQINCVAQVQLTTPTQPTAGGVTPVTGPAGGTAPLQTADCSPANIQTAATAGGYTLTSAQAQTFSCLSIPESGCRNNPGTATTPTGQTTTATGVFQVVLGINDTCHNLNLPVCTSAAQRAGYSVNGNLNCSSAFANGKVRPGMEILANACKAAGSDFVCNTSASACLLQQGNGSFSPWTSDPRASAQARCVATYNI